MSDTTPAGEPRTLINRRVALASSLGLGLGAAGLLSSRPASAATLDPANPKDAREIYRKLRYRSDTGLLFAWVKGPHLAEIGADLTPMHAINLGSIQRVTLRPDGGFDVRQLEISFTTDADTGKRLTTFRNPITNEVLPIKLRPPRPYSVSYAADNSLHAPAFYQGAKFEVTHYPASIVMTRDDVVMRDRTRALISPPGQAPRTLNEISTFTGPRAAVLDPSVTSVDMRLASNDITSWPSWLNMGARPGLLALYGVGGKAKSFDDMPADWLEMLSEVWPDVAANPIAALDRPIEG